MKRLLILSALAGACLSAALAWSFRESVAYAAEPTLHPEMLRLRSDLATLEARLYLAEGERCESLGVYPVPPPVRR